MAAARLTEEMREIEAALSTVWIGHPTRVLETVDSTNRYLKDQHHHSQLLAGTVVWADQQTAGRGRLGRTWVSPAGKNLYFSVLLEPPKERIGGVLSLLAGVAVIRAVWDVTKLEARMKWPNDGVIAGKKFCGILVEVGLDPEPWCVVGIGINVLAMKEKPSGHAIALQEVLGRPISRQKLLAETLWQLEQLYQEWLNRGDGWLVDTWTAHNATLGENVKVIRPGHADLIGWAEAIDEDGGLWVRTDAGRHKVISGGVSVRLADGRYAPESF